MRKIKFDTELKESLKKLREKLGKPVISDEKMMGISGGGCSAQCKTTCAWYCRPDIVSSEIVIVPE